MTGGVVRKDQHGMIMVDLTNIGYKDEPFVLGNDVHGVSM
jgi:hypothetical protein